MKNKKGVSVMIGYVLLIVGIVAMSVIVYSWLKSYVPRETLECPEGVSLFIEDSSCEFVESHWTLNLDVRNNGRFNISGYIIKATTTPEQEIAVLDISSNLVSQESVAGAGIITFAREGGLGIGDVVKNVEFDLDKQIFSIEIIPIRYELVEGKNRLVICGNSKIKEKVNCAS